MKTTTFFVNTLTDDRTAMKNRKKFAKKLQALIDDAVAEGYFGNVSKDFTTEVHGVTVTHTPYASEIVNGASDDDNS
jgi:hypothetical protein